MTSGIDTIDQRIIDLLREDGRMSVSEVATKAGVSRANAYVRLRKLEQTKAILGFSVVFDAERCGYGVSVFVAVKARLGSWESLCRKVEEIPEVVYAAAVSGDSDILLFVRAADAQALRTFVLGRLQQMPEVLGTGTMVVYDEKMFAGRRRS